MTPAIEPPSLDKELGMEVYLTDVEGIGGTIKKRYDDFLVEEVLRGFGKAGSHIKGSRGDGHLLCVVSRRGWETLHLVSELAKRLRIPRRCVSSAGFKDKRAYVKQFISIEGVDPVRVEGLRFNGVEVSPRGFIDEPLSSKLLMGNRFTIIVRNPSLELDKAQGVLAHMHSVMKGLGGFPNFYGYQRFGSARPVTHLVGRLMIRRRFEEAIRIYLGFAGSRECEEARVARRAYIEGGRLEEAYRLFP
ncbi:MAG: tRNA pseudouridine(13) synthase TruD, partial [Candidatus Bathyarchaeia archaeon]